MSDGIDYSKLNFRKKNPPASKLQLQRTEAKIGELMKLYKALEKAVIKLDAKMNKKTPEKKPTIKK